MNCLIAIRGMNPRLTAMSQSLLVDLGYEFKTVFNTNMSQSGTYLEEIIYNTQADFIINVDEDAYVFDSEALMALLNHMNDFGYGFCGVPDGGVIHHRTHNPIVPNPFFNIFNAKLLRQIRPNHIPYESDDRVKGLFDVDLIKFTPSNLIKGDISYLYDNFQWQYYHLFFNWLRNDIKPLYLDAIDGDDKISTIVLNHDNKPFLEHTWFARHYREPDNDGIIHFDRINEVYNKYIKSKQFDIGIVVPSFNIPDSIKHRFLLQLESINPNLKYIVSFVDDVCLTNSYFNPSMCRNIGIKQLLNNCDVIVCCDVDMMIPKGLLEFTYCKCLQINGLLFSYTRFLDFDSWKLMIDSQIINIPSTSSGVGGWIAMPSRQWINCGGWNESLYGWGYEDQELHNRISKLNIPSTFTNSFPLVHINHPVRNSNFKQTQHQNINISNNNIIENWLIK